MHPNVGEVDLVCFSNHSPAYLQGEHLEADRRTELRCANVRVWGWSRRSRAAEEVDFPPATHLVA